MIPYGTYCDTIDEAFEARLHKLFDTLVSNLAGDDEEGSTERFKRGVHLAVHARNLAINCIEQTDLLEESEDGDPSS